MILVDSSVWIDYFIGIKTKETDRLDDILGRTPIAIGDLILAEVLQGFKHDKDYRMARRVFESVSIFNMLGYQNAIKSADNYRALRRAGVTIRNTADVIIATFCIEAKLPWLFTDKDFHPFVEYLGLCEA